jgi:mono/diheme cytochrome c family protein
MRTGPDGALYIADFYRAVLEHPEWIAPETQSRLNLRAGEDRGRMYRVAPTVAVLRHVPNLASMGSLELAAAMDHPNGWQRDTAQRLLVERKAVDTASTLTRLALTAASPKVRVQALCTLGLLERLTVDTVSAALADVHPAVRRQAVQLSETFAAKQDPRLWKALAALRVDPDFAVRQQLAFSLGEWKSPEAAAILDELATREGDQELMRVAVLSSVGADSPWMQRLAERPKAVGPPARLPVLAVRPDPARARIAASYREVANRRGNAARGHDLFGQSCAVCHRLKREGNPVGPDLDMVADKPLDWILTAVFDPNAAVEARYQAQRVLTRDNAEYVGLLRPGAFPHAGRAGGGAGTAGCGRPGGVAADPLNRTIRLRFP